jgi:amino acid transporter
MFGAVALVSLSYVLPISAVALTKLSPSAWETGSWADVAGLLGGPLLRIALVLGGMMSAFGMFNALVMSYSRLPLAMAQDGMLPAIFSKVTKRSGAPWVSILVLATGWGLCLGLGFERLVTIDILVYGTSLLLEFIALVALRIREPNLPRPFRVPGGIIGAVFIGVVPMLLLAFSIVRSEHEQILGFNSLLFGTLLIVAGFAAYSLDLALRSVRSGSEKSARLD